MYALYISINDTDVHTVHQNLIFGMRASSERCQLAIDLIYRFSVIGKSFMDHLESISWQSTIPQHGYITPYSLRYEIIYNVFFLHNQCGISYHWRNLTVYPTCYLQQPSHRVSKSGGWEATCPQKQFLVGAVSYSSKQNDWLSLHIN